MPYKDPDEARRSSRASYHRRKHDGKHHANQRRLTKRRQEWMDSLKFGRPCADCGGVFPPECMDWDHLDADAKLFTVASNKHRAVWRVEAEMAKCELVCANCHRIRTRRRIRRRDAAQEAADDLLLFDDEVVA